MTVELDGARVLVVGATGGLGSGLARELVRRGARLVLGGRSAERLDALAGEMGDGVAGTAVADLLQPDGPRRLVEAAVDVAGGLDGVVVAAGVVAFGPAADVDDDALDEVLVLNLLAPVRLLRAAVPHLEAAASQERASFVVHVSAVVAEQPMAGMAAYTASKAALTAFDAAASRELRRRGVHLLDARPPHTETGLAGRPVAGEAPRLPPGLDPAAVARRIVDAVAAGERDLPASAFS